MKKHIELQGKQYPVAFNMLILEDFLEGEGATLADISEYLGGHSLRKMFKLLLHMMKAGAERAGDKLEMDVMELADMVGMDVDKVSNVILSTMPNLEPEKKQPRQAKAKAKA